ncbi:hypothetical protein DRO21_04920, partial [archaeon]
MNWKTAVLILLLSMFMLPIGGNYKSDTASTSLQNHTIMNYNGKYPVSIVEYVIMNFTSEMYFRKGEVYVFKANASPEGFSYAG